jgi:uncharacterized protein YbjT (DUF2867 family)
MAKILVLGATGAIGGEVVKALAKKDVHFKAAVHNASKAEDLKKLSSKIEVVEVDLYNPTSLANALKGIESVFVLTPPGQTIQPSQNILTEAKKAHVKHIVKLSAYGIDDPKWFLGQEHLQVEKLFHDSEIPTTNLRPTSFMSNQFGSLQTIKEQGKIYAAFGDTKINFIAPSDIGEVAAVVLTTPGHGGKTYELTGPDNLSQAEVAKIFSELLGKEVQYVAIDDETLRKQAATFLPPDAIDNFVGMIVRFRAGIYDTHYVPVVKNLIGRDAVSFRDWLAAGPIYAFK